MGVDPGLVATGFGVLEAGPGGVTVVDAGVISTTTGQVLEARLNAIYRAVHRLIEAHAPSLLIVEDLYTEYKFPRTAVLMGHARGVIYLAARQLEVPLLALTPSEVKRAITGNGAAGKAQVQRAVQTLLGLASVPHPSHIADALGLAVTGMARLTGRIPSGRATVARGVPRSAAPERPMIASVRGRLRRRFEDRVVVEAAGVGYEVFIPPVVQRALADAVAGDGDGADEVLLMVHYHATQNQPRPVLIGFTSDLDKEFFEKLITVKDVGPLVAARVPRRAGRRDRRRHRPAGRGLPAAHAGDRAPEGQEHRRSAPGEGGQVRPGPRRSRGSGEARPGRAHARGRRGTQDPGLRGAREAARPPAE